MADVSVRPARPEDAERAARVQLSTWRTAYSDLLPPEVLDVPEEQVAAVWLRGVEVPPSHRHRLLVAMDGPELVGLAVSEPVDDATVELTALIVEPRWGRRGHGSRLLAASVDHWRGDGATHAQTWAWERDDATRSFLESSGWEPDGVARSLDTGQRQVRLHVSLEES
ncbi:MAG: GNAT family N-acetyltransferase [Mycobacteriales bacterium]|nr:GNAT family N-acetyltransferase [Mycobacteriales bacterium]